MSNELKKGLEDLQYFEEKFIENELSKTNIEIINKKLFKYSAGFFSAFQFGIFFTIFTISFFYDLGLTDSFYSGLLVSILSLPIALLISVGFYKDEKKSKERNRSNEIKKGCILTKEELENHYKLISSLITKSKLENIIEITEKSEDEQIGSVSFLKKVYKNTITYMDKKEKNTFFLDQVKILSKNNKLNDEKIKV